MMNKLGQISLGVCGLATVIVIVGLIARLSVSLTRICGTVLLVSLVFSVYRIAKDRNM